MKALGVVTRSLFEKTKEKDRYEIAIDGNPVPLAFVEANAPTFQQNDPKFDDQVLIKKASFSLNFRDMGLIELAWGVLRNNESDGYYAIGSDFAGTVELCGKNVTGLAVGDLVMGNCSFPVGEKGAVHGIPSNNSSRQYEILHYGKLVKVPDHIPVAEAGAMNIGVQTASSMVNRAKINKGDNVLVTSVTSNTSFFLLNALRSTDCKVYGISYSGMNKDRVQSHFPFIEEIYNFADENLPGELTFDVVLDPFADTYIEALVKKLNFGARYLTCGVFNQTAEKKQNQLTKNLSELIMHLMVQNAQLIGNCLGTTQDLVEGLEEYKPGSMASNIFTEDNSLEEFITNCFNINQDKFGKAVYQF